MKIYISGKITGDRRYKAKFREVEKKLAAAGHIVLNPATAPEGLRPVDYMRLCFAMMEAADVVLFMQDYQDSRGAMLEWAWCQYVGKQTCFDLGDVLAELKPRRKVNLPDFPAIVRAAMADGMDICVYCQSFGCNECIVNEWKNERSDEE